MWKFFKQWIGFLGDWATSVLLCMIFVDLVPSATMRLFNSELSERYHQYLLNHETVLRIGSILFCIYFINSLFKNFKEVVKNNNSEELQKEDKNLSKGEIFIKMEKGEVNKDVTYLTEIVRQRDGLKIKINPNNKSS